MLSGWMTVSIRSISTSKSHFASITSRPLFMSVAESMVTLPPIDHVGWDSAEVVTILPVAKRHEPRPESRNLLAKELAIVLSSERDDLKSARIVGDHIERLCAHRSG